MSFLETVSLAKAYLREHGRVSLHVLRRGFDLDAATLEELVDELVDVQQVAARQGKVLSWIGASPEPPASAAAARGEDPAARAGEGERRQLTVLFCDLVDSTRLASQMDPEDWREVVRRYQEATAGVVGRFDGHVAQYLGDGILVYFGYPRAHEDDAERAVRGGLGIVGAIAAINDELEREHGCRLEVRVGIHTGAVVVGRMGGGASHESLAMGGATNLAARLQSEAGPDTVVLSAATLRLVQGVFVTRDLGLHTFKGVREPVHVHQALRSTGVRSRLDVVSADDRTPLVGRDEELGQLLGRWERVQDGLGQVVVVSGEAGVGKSRLVQSLHERLVETPHTWLECGGSSFARDSAFHPIIELVRHGFLFSEEETPEQKVERLRTALQQNQMQVAEVLPLLASLLSLPLPEGFEPAAGTPERVKRLTREALLDWLFRLGGFQPLVLVMEDLHWMDASTLELVDLLVERVASAPLLVVLTHRPEFEPSWGELPHLTRLPVARLSQRQAATMVRHVAEGRALPDVVVQTIVERADGVPLFVEELTKTTLDSDAAARRASPADSPLTAIPETLQDSLMARLDRLSPEKELAQLAATVGREFPHELLEAVSPFDEETLRRGLERLVDAELLYRRGSAPHASYVFKHALVQETAYQSLLKARRQAFHRQIAEALERRFPEAAEERPEQLAHHFTRAGLAAEALPYWQRAGQRAVQRSANVEAVHQLGRGLEALERIEAGPERDRQELGLRTLLGIALIATAGYSDREVLRNFARARKVCEALGDTPALFPVLLGLFRFYLVRSDREATARLVDQCLRLADRSEEPALRFFSQLAAGLRAFYAGEHESSRDYLARTWELYDPEQREAYTLAYGQDPGVSAQMHAAWNEWYLGYPDRARDLVKRGLDHAEPSGQSFGRAGGFVSASRLWRLRGEGEEALRCAEASIAISREQGFSTWLWAGLLCRGTALGLLGETEQAIAEVLIATRDADSIGTQLFVPHAYCELASLYLEAGRADEALEALDRARERVRTNLDVYEEADIHRLRGEALLRSADAGAAEPCFESALQISRKRRTRSLELRAATSLARLRRSQGRKAEALELLRPVHDWFSEGLDTHDLRQAKAVLDALA